MAIKAPQLTGIAEEHLPRLDTKDKKISVFAGDMILDSWFPGTSRVHTSSQEQEVRVKGERMLENAK